MWVNRKTWETVLTERATLLARVNGLEEYRDALKNANARLREEREQERERANRAVDELLALRGIGPVTPPPKPEGAEDLSRMFEEDADEVAELKKRLEEEGAVAVIRQTDWSGSA